MSKLWQIEEIQGLYGPFTVSEKVLQKIWRRGDFRSVEIATVSGKRVRVLDRGRWNQNEGPDFKEARLEIGGEEIVGDVEIHFYAKDWFTHGHDRDPNFDRVVLDVVLFQPRRLPSSYHRSGKADPELLVLLPLIDLDLEAYALEDALLESEGTDVPAWMKELFELAPMERLEVLNTNACKRWSQKVVFAESRLESLGWAGACHQMALEVLGYGRNREVMHRVANYHSPADFAQLESVDGVFDRVGAKWRLQGIRPANHPKKRLEQYQKICRRNPKWPGALESILRRLPRQEGLATTAEFRRMTDMSVIQKRIADEVFASEIGDSRLNTMMCDAIMPLASALGIFQAKSFWQHWYPGDAPEPVLWFLKSAQVVDRASPMSVGLIQGALQMFLNEGARSD